MSSDDKRKNMGDAALKINEPTFLQYLFSPSKVRRYVAYKKNLTRDAKKKIKQAESKVSNGANPEETRLAIKSACIATITAITDKKR